MQTDAKQNDFEPHIRRVLEARAHFLVLPTGPKARDFALNEWSRMLWLAWHHRNEHEDADSQVWLTVYTSSKNRVRVDDRRYLSPRQLIDMQRVSSVFRMSDYHAGLGKPCTLFIDRQFVKKVMTQARASFFAEDKLERAEELRESSLFQLVTTMLSQAPKSGRLHNKIQGLAPELKAIIFEGCVYNDISKAHLGVVARELGPMTAPILNDLYDNSDVMYPRMADGAQCDASLVKLFVNLSVQGRVPTSHAKDGWMKEALKQGMLTKEAIRALVTLKASLSGALAEARIFWARRAGGNPRERTKILSRYLMRRVADYIIYGQALCEQLGNDTWNVHDGFYSAKPVEPWVFEHAARETGVGTLRMVCAEV